HESLAPRQSMALIPGAELMTDMEFRRSIMDCWFAIVVRSRPSRSPHLRGDLRLKCRPPVSENLLRRGGREEMHEPSDNAGPAGLVAGAEAGSVIAMEVFVEQNQVAPVRVLLKLSGAAIDRTPAIFAAQKNAGQSARDLCSHLVEVHLPA